VTLSACASCFAALSTEIGFGTVKQVDNSIVLSTIFPVSASSNRDYKMSICLIGQQAIYIVPRIIGLDSTTYSTMKTVFSTNLTF
jgi:hypothetical protein